MKNKNLLAMVALAAIGLQACHNSDKQNTGASTTTISADSTLDTLSDVAKNGKTKLDDGQTDFVLNAALGSMTEIETGNIALQKTKVPFIKKFAQMMVTDHTKASAELTRLAARKGLGLPKTLPVEKRADIDALQSVSGDGFDRDYMKMMVTDHSETLKQFRLASKFPDTEIRDFASKSLPMLEEHFKQASEISTKLEKQKINNGDDVLKISPTKEENKK